MERKKPELSERIEVCRNLCINVSRNAGITKAFKEIIDQTGGSKASYYLKSIFENQFKQLIIDLNVLTLDSRSEFQIGKLISDFEKKFGGKLKNLGLGSDIKIEEKYREELGVEIELWNNLRNKIAAHRDFNVPKEFSVDPDKISIFIVSICKIINTMNETVAVPQAFVDGKIQSTSYGSVSAVNLEEESYKTVLKHLEWNDAL